ncbi:hypothetical protein Q1695_002563 [Nippostrongylus brasiliensis]|nr:hypothetical protein Q1695_002563 [Nippostrongylus brasiliensis]
MDPFNLILKDVMRKPDVAGLRMICAQVEAWESYNPGKVKEKAQRAVSSFLTDGTLAGEEDMLRLYNIVAKHSKKLGAPKIFEKVDEQGHFEKSLKFHMMWAETCGRCGDLNQFSRVFSLAKSRLTTMSIIELETGFREVANQFFPDADLFNDCEETVAIFSHFKQGENKPEKTRRRSSLATFEARVKDNMKVNPSPDTNVPSFGPGTRTKLRLELIDRPSSGYIAPSIEELRAAIWADKQDNHDDDFLHVPMDITMTHEIPTPNPQHVAAPNIKEHCKRNRVLETVEECESDRSNDDKRRRVFSPAAPPRSSVLASKPQKASPMQSQPNTQTSSSATFITGSSFTEKAYNDMKAMLSDTVDINKAGVLPGITDDTTLPVAPPPVEAFEVFLDKDESQRPNSALKKENLPPSQVDCFSGSQGDRAPLQPISVRPAAGDADVLLGSKVKKTVDEPCYDDKTPKPRKPFLIEDEETMAGAKFTILGIHKKPDRGIVTSTPAHQMVCPPTHEDFFAPLNHELEEQMKEKDDEEEIYAQSAFMRRRSVAPSKPVVTVSKLSAPKVRPVMAAERSMEIALDKMNLGDPEDDTKGDDDDVDVHDKTGVGLVMEAVTSAVNPWDPHLRKQILARAPVPCYQHTFDVACLRVSAGKSMSFGGEAFSIVKLIGEGGFAKVYKVINEDGKTLALKFEVPPCPWEVYICNEVKMRLGKNHRFTLESIMEVTDAYIYTNGSILMNEYHPFGTLLDLTNKLNDPGWYIILLVAVQIAKILRDVHAVKIIHGDVKPDNFMILDRLNENIETPECALSKPIVKLIDWGRAIDMRALPGQKFTGRAGTQKFDCSEMLDGRPWTYQTDYFGYACTMHVVIFNKYAEVTNEGGAFRVQGAMKRRLSIRPLMEEMFHDFLNIRDCESFPDWGKYVEAMETFFIHNFNALEWRSAVQRFNQCLSVL